MERQGNRTGACTSDLFLLITALCFGLQGVLIDFDVIGRQGTHHTPFFVSVSQPRKAWPCVGTAALCYRCFLGIPKGGYGTGHCERCRCRRVIRKGVSARAFLMKTVYENTSQGDHKNCILGGSGHCSQGANGVRMDPSVVDGLWSFQEKPISISWLGFATPFIGIPRK